MKEVYCEEVIISKQDRRGKGVQSDPVRALTQVFTKQGELIAEHDPFYYPITRGQVLDFANHCRENKITATADKLHEWLNQYALHHPNRRAVSRYNVSRRHGEV